jgi:hypothetical protein
MSNFQKLIDMLRKRADELSIQPSAVPKKQEEVTAQGPSSGVIATGQKTVEVPDPWDVGKTGPFILEQKPDINAILSAQNPTPPPKMAEWAKRYQNPAKEIRGYLAMAYMHHPSAEVREATIRFVCSQSRDEFSIGLILAQRLTVEPTENLRRLAAEAIWSRGNEELLETMKYLAGNDEHPGDDGNGAIVSQTQVRGALQTLRDSNPADEREFNHALFYAWCWHDELLAEFGQTLIDLWQNGNTYLYGQSRTIAREMGIKIHARGGINAMEMMFKPVTLLAGQSAALELGIAWEGIGGW